MKFNCSCDEWTLYVEAMKMFYTLGYSHGIAYIGPYFKFCPFCGKWWGLTTSSDLGWKQELTGEMIEEENENNFKKGL